MPNDVVYLFFGGNFYEIILQIQGNIPDTVIDLYFGVDVSPTNMTYLIYNRYRCNLTYYFFENSFNQITKQ